GNIILSGHSGGYHVISFILMRGGLNQNIKEIFLFDALYGQTEKFVYWFTKFGGKMINIYTESGGTKEESEALMEDLDGWGIPYFSSVEKSATLDDLKNNKLIFLFTKLDHNQCQYTNNNFKNYLSASKSLKNISKITR
ncbi:MAG: hypothetical protein N3A61_05905, partial [Ignavibacteria bacterium]|nr:hypothetical protein [Ignavibacteria bacterium]